MREVPRLGLILERLAREREPEFDHLPGLPDIKQVSLDRVGMINVLDPEVSANPLQYVGREPALSAEPPYPLIRISDHIGQSDVIQVGRPHNLERGHAHLTP